MVPKWITNIRNACQIIGGSCALKAGDRAILIYSATSITSVVAGVGAAIWLVLVQLALQGYTAPI